VTQTELFGLLPLLILSAAPLVIMVLLAIKRNLKAVVVFSGLALAAAFFSIFFASNLAPLEIVPLFSIDNFALFYMALFFGAGFFICLLSYGYFSRIEGNSEEFFLLLLVATLGSSVLVASRNFVSFFLGLEILSVSLYGLIGYTKNRKESIEAGVKYLVLAAASAAFLLFGIALLYAESGTLDFASLSLNISTGHFHLPWLFLGTALLIVGIGFKLAVVPFHMWTPDVYQGAPAPAAAYLATVSKGAMFAFLFRFFFLLKGERNPSMSLAFTIIAVASMLAGNLLAVRQNKVKRILAYSSIAHLGYLLVTLLVGGETGLEAATFYLVAYFVTILGAFGVITILSQADRDADSLEEYRGLFWRRPLISAVFTAMLLSLAGIPLTAGFLGKFYVAGAGVRASLWLPVVVLVISSVIGLYYYLRIIVAMFSQTKTEEVSGAKAPLSPLISLGGGVALAGLLLFLIWFGVYPSGLIQIIRGMVGALNLAGISSAVSLF
jgi:NADH-quinone oxidoreductase subunit N